jgi:hypothetical protein
VRSPRAARLVTLRLLRTDTPACAQTADGRLCIRATAQSGQYHSAKLFCRHPLGRESGYLEFTTHLIPQINGCVYSTDSALFCTDVCVSLWPALWLLPTNGTEVLHDGKARG